MCLREDRHIVAFSSQYYIAEQKMKLKSDGFYYNCNTFCRKKQYSTDLFYWYYSIIPMSESDMSIDSTDQTNLHVKSSSQIQKDSRNVTIFESIMREIRDMNVLSSYQIYYLRNMSKDKLLQIIELYNVVMRNVNEIL